MFYKLNFFFFKLQELYILEYSNILQIYVRRRTQRNIILFKKIPYPLLAI